MDAIRSAFLSRLLGACRTRLAEPLGPRLRDVILFGSWARGAATEDSDIDVAIVVDGLTSDERDEVLAMAADLDAQEGSCLSPFAVSARHFQQLLDDRRRIARDVVSEGTTA